mmetsp:Transcript_46221/g.100382  ORF Transcript_46221/g.100382 Transcript_46221/m.100382 type:complete len:243 (-) Transcript_46221:508-1236(-)
MLLMMRAFSPHQSRLQGHLHRRVSVCPRPSGRAGMSGQAGRSAMPRSLEATSGGVVTIMCRTMPRCCCWACSRPRPTSTGATCSAVRCGANGRGDSAPAGSSSSATSYHAAITTGSRSGTRRPSTATSTSCTRTSCRRCRHARASSGCSTSWRLPRSIRSRQLSWASQPSRRSFTCLGCCRGCARSRPSQRWTAALSTLATCTGQRGRLARLTRGRASARSRNRAAQRGTAQDRCLHFETLR